MRIVQPVLVLVQVFVGEHELVGVALEVPPQAAGAEPRQQLDGGTAARERANRAEIAAPAAGIRGRIETRRVTEQIAEIEVVDPGALEPG